MSGSLLKYKFVFEVLEDGLFTKDMYLTCRQLINTKLILQPRYLGKYIELYDKLRIYSIKKPGKNKNSVMHVNTRIL